MARLLAGLARQWATDPDMSHGFFVLPVVAFVVWRSRGKLVATQTKPNWWGFGIAVWGAVQMLLGTLAAQVFLARTAFLVSLTGAVLFLGGTRALKTLAFPLLLDAFSVSDSGDCLRARYAAACRYSRRRRPKRC